MSGAGAKQVLLVTARARSEPASYMRHRNHESGYTISTSVLSSAVAAEPVGRDLAHHHRLAIARSLRRRSSPEELAAPGRFCQIPDCDSSVQTLFGHKLG
jgi:hypothetical protein